MSKRVPPSPSSSTRIPVRGADGRLYGYYEPSSHTLEVKRGSSVEKIKLPTSEQPPKP